MTDIVERLRTDAAAWGGATHTVTGPRVEKLGLEAAAEIERLRAALSAVYEWYDRDGSVGGASIVFEKHRVANEQSTK